MGTPGPGVGRRSYGYVWDSSVLAWTKETQPAGGGAAGSTIVTVSTIQGVVSESPASTGWASSAGFHFDVGGNLLMAGGAGGSSQVTLSQVLDSSGGGVVVGDSANAAVRVNVVAGAAGGSTIVTISTGHVTVDNFSTQVNVSNFSTNVTVSTGHVTVDNFSTQVAVSNFSTTVNVSSLAGKVLVDQNSSVWQVQVHGDSTSFQGGTWNINVVTSISSLSTGHVTVDNFSTSVLATIGTNLQSTSAPSSGSSGLIVRQVYDTFLSAASSNAFASTSLTIQSSVAGVRSYVYAYSITTTNQTPVKIAFFDGATMKWPLVLAAISSAVAGVNLAVTPPACLFKGSVAAPMTLQIPSSQAGWKVGVSYYQAP